ncbi:MAG TPA: TIGR02680 family protein [Acidimicrobiales bacterium]|nr:TIGR02680 family protein [Acidimicrobiales bacterium]
MNDSVTVLPVTGTDRWRPTRAGLVNLWRYWDETFTFHHGRLLLRGANGSGKSMALELLLPFLLDGDASPSKLTSAAKARGGLYDRVMTGAVEPTRAGFAWVELRRGDEVFTAGVRIRASSATHKADTDFFTTALAVGTDFTLLDVNRAPLSRKALVEALGDRGRVHSSADEHRAAVREALFPGFGADRYTSVITALLALRKEKLSQNLDLAKLSEVLSEALPPLDDHDLAVVAEGFERLDRRRDELKALEAELAEVRTLAARQRDYARALTAAVGGQVRRAETRRDDVTRAERTAAATLEAARAEAEAVEMEAVALAARLADVDTEVEALKASDAYRDGAKLDDLRSESGRLRELVERDRRTAEDRRCESERQAAVLRELEGERQTTAGNLELAAADLRRAAVPVAADSVATEAQASGADDGERLLRAWVRSRRQLIEEVRAALRDHERAVQQRVFAETRVESDQAAVDDRFGARRTARAAHGDAVAAYSNAVVSWVASCAAAGVERVQAAIPSPSADPAEVIAAARSLAADLRAEHAVARHALATARSEIEATAADLAEERDRLAEGRLVDPLPPSWRTDRAGRAGAPLWRLVDVPEWVPAGDVDGLEAALEAAGLLDAWVTPDGSVDLPDGSADIVLGRRPVEGPTVADFLLPLDDAVAGVLASIAVGSSLGDGPEVIVCTDGTFRLGPATGRGSVRPAELLGAAAQERHRLARLAQVEAALAEADAGLAGIGRDAAAMDARVEAALADLDACPDGDPVNDAARRVELAEARLAEAEDRLVASRTALAEAEDAVRRALRLLATLGDRYQLPTTADGVEEVVAALTALEGAAGTWARRARDLAAVERHHRRAAEDADRAAAAAADAAGNVKATERAAAEVEVRLATLESTIGTEYKVVLDRITRLDVGRRRGRDRQRELSELRPQMQRQIGKLENELAQAETARAQADEERARAHRKFVALVSDGIVADTGVVPTVATLDGVTAVLDAARALAAELGTEAADDQSVDRASARVEERLHHARAALGSRVDLAREMAAEGWWVLRATAGGIRRAVREQARALAAELAEGRAELAADEERLFEQTLAGSVRQALADRIRLSNQLVDGINRQLGEVRSVAGGVQVRLKWEVDDDQPQAVKAARTLLLRDPAGLSDEERASLQDFVRARVDQARAELEANASWEARLRETLDYRAWHRFTLQLAHRDWEGFQPATAKRLQRLSTGERSVALHLPMLASIAAHYTDVDGRPAGCPRLILLDELFAGVDGHNRAQLFGTFTAWDLDAVFTSDHEWCQYASLDGIAIHHLHPAVGDEPVTSTRFTWDGRRRELDPTAA